MLFVRLHEFLATNKALAEKFQLLEQRIARHDAEIQAIFEAIRKLMKSPDKPKRQIGFKVEEPLVKYSIKRKKRTFI